MPYHIITYVGVTYYLIINNYCYNDFSQLYYLHPPHEGHRISFDIIRKAPLALKSIK